MRLHRYAPRVPIALLLFALASLACGIPFLSATAPTSTPPPVVAAQPTIAGPTLVPTRAVPPPAPSVPQPTAAPTLPIPATGSSGLISAVVLAQQVTPLSYTPIGASDVFPPKATLHVVVSVSNAVKSISVKVVLTAVDVGSAAAPNTKAGEYALDAVGTQNLEFAFQPVAKGFPLGSYKVDILVGDKLDRTLDFTVKDGVAVIPTVTMKAVGNCPSAAQGALQPSAFIKQVTLAESIQSSTLDPVNPTNLFKPSSQVHAVVALQNAAQNTSIKAVWYALDTGGAEACNTRIAEYTIATNHESGNIEFTYKPPSNFPLGNYRVEIFVNNTLSHSLDFSVK